MSSDSQIALTEPWMGAGALAAMIAASCAARGRSASRVTTSETSPISRARPADIRSSRPSSVIRSISPSGMRWSRPIDSSAALMP
jgi:hypothetical protein